MGKKATRPLKAKRKPEKDRPALNHSDSYSDDYRMTPDILLQGLTPYCNGPDCCSRRRACPQGEFCCSRETCLPPERRYRRKPSSASPCGRKCCDILAYENQNLKDYRRPKKEMEVIVVNDRRLTVRKTPSYCSSCDSCASGGSSFTRIDLTNDLFTSPLETTQASFYDIFPSRNRRQISPKNPISANPARNRRKSRKRIDYSSDEDIEDYERRRLNPQQIQRNSRKDKLSAGEVTKSSEILTPDRSRIVPPGNRSSSGVNEELRRNKIKNERNGRDRSRPFKSPTRNSPRTTNDSGMGKSYRTSGSSGLGASSRSGEGNSKAKGSERENWKGEKEESRSSNLKQVNLLNKMVNQTREHRKQIKTLESELERLRSSGDALSNCEILQNDVEWRPGDVVGEGSFSTVYKGNFCGTEVAVKELKFKLSQDDKNYFRSEAALLQQLHHPRVVLLMGVCTTSARPFMLLEYLSGGTLYSLIHTKTRERLDHAAYFVIAKDVAQGLNYLHKHEPQVLHLDLKSMNVLLDGYTRAKIADFGFSILRRSRGGRGGSAVQRGSIRGTPAWMSPELLTKGEVSPKCDVYSYAIILWEMLTASHPFQGLDIYHIMEAVEDGIRPPLPQSGISQELKELITSCWAQNPSLRPSFEEILGALETASLPSSWRKIITKANIAPTTLSDLKTARALISMIERSIEFYEKSKGHRKRSKSDDETEIEMIEDKNRKNRISKKYTIHDSLALSSEKGSKVHNSKGRKYRQASNSRENKSSNSDKRDKHSPSKRNPSPRREKGKIEVRGFSPKRKSRMDPESFEYLESRGRRVSKPLTPKQNDSYRERNSRNYSRSPSKGGSPRKDMRDRGERRKIDKSFSYSKSQHRDENLTVEESNFSDTSSHKENKRISKEEERGKLQTDSSLSSDEIDSQISTRRSYVKKSSERSKQRQRSRTSSAERSRAITPKKRSPTRKPYSSEKAGNDHKHHENALPQKYAGMILTAEQLLSQKQRLRPVRPTGLKDLSMMPQSSLNDISFILKQAILQRREAFDHLQSAKGTSKDIDWSDWF